MKHILLLGLSAALLILSQPAYAQMETREIRVPANVTVIEEEAFAGLDSEHVILPGSIRSIKGRAFAESNISHINLPEMIEYISPDAFDKNNQITATVAPGSYALGWCCENGIPAVSSEDGTLLVMDRYPWKVKDGRLLHCKAGQSSGTVGGSVPDFHLSLPDGIHTIGSSAFIGSGVTHLDLPEMLTTLEGNAFFQSYLKEIDLPKGVSYIGPYAFSNSSFLQRISMPGKISFIPKRTFCYCKSLETVLLSDTVTSIGEEAFFQCEALKDFHMPANLQEIGNLAFALCRSLPSADLPEGVRSIGRLAFGGCSSLSRVTLPSTLRSIGDLAFGECSALQTLTIPENVTYIGEDAFTDCGSLTLLVYEGSYAESYAEANHIPYEVLFDEDSAWKAAPVLNPISVNTVGQFCLSWTGSSSADEYEVYEITGDSMTATPVPDSNGNGTSYIIENGTARLAAYVTGTSAILSGTARGTHYYMVRPVKTMGTRRVPGRPSNIRMVQTAEDLPEPPYITYADQTGSGTVTLRWNGEAPAYTVMEQMEDGSLQAVLSTAECEAVLTGVSSGIHPYSVRADGTGGTSLSGFRFITVLGNPTGVWISESMIKLHISQSLTLSARPLPFGMPDPGEITWFSSDSTVASVDDTGLVTGVSAGTATITAAARGGEKAVCTVEILNDMTVTRGDFVVENGVLTAYNGHEENLIIPSDLGIWKIGDKAFWINGSLKTLDIPEGVVQIGTSAFYDCYVLNTVRFPRSLEEIESSAFNLCTSLQTVEIPGGVSVVGEKAFYKCDNLTSASFGYGVEEIGENAFYACKKLTSLSVPESIKKIGYQAFYDCDALTSAALYGDLGSYAFAYCDSLHSLSVSGNIGFRAFAGCKALKQINMDQEVRILEDEAFSSCISLEEIIVPPSVASGGSGVFSGCTALKKAVITCQGLRGLKNLTTVTIQPGTREIMPMAFYECGTLEKISIPDSVEKIGDMAFQNCSSLSEIRLPDHIMFIGDDAFNGCKKLTEIRLPDGLKKGGDSLFRNCESLVCVTAPSGDDIKYVNTFFGCTASTLVVSEGSSVVKGFGTFSKVEHVELPETVVRIDNSAFSGCYNLQEISMHRGITDIGKDAFNYCTALKDICLPEGLTRIGENAFKGCSGLMSAALPSSLEQIGSSAFSGCTGLEEIDLPGGLKSLGSSAFEGCTALTGISIPDDVTEIEAATFKDCTALMSASLPASLSSIGTYAFGSCSSLRAIQIPEGTAAIGKYAFYSCSSLEKAVIPATVNSIESNITEHSFRSCENLTIYGFKGTVAQTYAKQRSIPFIAIDEASGPDTVVTDEEGTILMGTGMTCSSLEIFGEPTVSMVLATTQPDPNCYSDDPDIVNARLGVIRALKEGTTVVTMHLKLSDTVKRCTVHVVGGFLEPSVDVGEGESISLPWALEPGYKAGGFSVWKDGGYPGGSTLEVDSTGRVTGVKSQRPCESVRMDLGGGLYSSCRINVLRQPVRLELTPHKLLLGLRETETVTASPREAWTVDGPYRYESSDPDIASVSETGKVTARRRGSAVITAYAENGASGECGVVVLPDGYTKDDVISKMNAITQDYNMLLFLNDFLHGGTTAPWNGQYVEGFRIEDLTGGLAQNFYADYFGCRNGKLEGRLFSACYVADNIMMELAARNRSKIDWGVLKETFTGTVGYIGTLNSTLERICEAEFVDKTFQHFKEMSEDKTFVKDNAEIVARSMKSYAADRTFDLEKISAVADLTTFASGFVQAMSRFLFYLSVDTEELNTYIDQLEAAGDPDLQITASVLRQFSPEHPLDCLTAVLSYFGVKPAAEQLSRHLTKELTSKGIEVVIGEISPFGFFLKGCKIGASVGKLFNNLVLNIDELQANAFKAENAFAAAENFRPVFVNAYKEFKADNLNLNKYLAFTRASIVFRTLVAEEYDAFGKIASALNDSAAHKVAETIEKCLNDLGNFLNAEHNEYEDKTGYAEEYSQVWAKRARWSMESLKNYGLEILSLSEVPGMMMGYE